MLKLSSIAVACLLLGVADASAQDCETRALALDDERTGELDASDCYFPTECDECPRGGRGEYWTLVASAGDVIAITIRKRTMQNPPSSYVSDGAGGFPSSGRGVADTGASLVWFAARTTGTFRLLLIGRGNQVGSYTLRAQRVTTPLDTKVEVTVNGNRIYANWFEPASGSPILEYVLEAGSRAGASDIGVFSMGTSTNVTATGVPGGTYFLRVRARSALGWGLPSADASFTTSGLPPPPSGLFVRVSGRSVSLLWYAPSGGPPVLHYELLVGSSQGTANLGVVPVTPAGDAVSPGIGLSYVVPDVPPGIYFVRVRAITTAGPSEPSNEEAIITF
jgi:hypothetical protein